ncbi:MAG: flagellar biosynthesis protein FliQ [Proteobacteria bacterium]|nr:flagellar biosynthesis protein FliQ [Pseudomonadota bacterium]
MSTNDILEIGTDAILTLLLVGSPIMGVALAVGLMISLFQALTQMQEQTLSFVPKVTAMVVTFMLFLPFMMSTMTGFAERMFERVATLG